MVQNIATLARSMFEGLPFACKPDSFYNAFKPIHSLTQTFDVPVAMFILPDLKDTDREELKAHGLSEFPSRRNAFVGTPNPTVLSTIFSLGPVQSRGDVGYVSADAYLAFVYAIKGSQIFSTSTRAAVMTSKGNAICSTTLMTHGSIDDDTIPLYQMGGSIGMARKVLDVEVATTVNYHDSPIAVFNGIAAHTNFPGYFASMSGPLSIPNKEKLFFGYFDGMVLPDKTTFCHVFPKLFFHSLAADVDRAQKLWRRLRAGYRSMAYTSTGKIISHLYYGMNLAIEAQASFTPVIEGNRYCGFILEASNLVVAMHDQKIEGGTESQLIEALGSLNQHEGSLQKILEMIREPLLGNGKPVYDYTLDDLSTSRKLRNMLYRLDFSLFGATFTKDLSDRIDRLQFSEAFSPPKARDIEIFLQFVLTDNVRLLEDYPAYLRSGMFAKQSRVAMGLSIFGGRVPTISYGSDKDGARSFSLLHGDDDPNLKKDDKNKRALPYLPFSSVGVVQGLSQWEIMFKAGVFRVPQPRKGKAESFTNNTLVNLKITDDKHFTEVYRVMKLVAKEEQKAKSAGKRGRDTEEDRGNVKKSKGKAADVASDI